MNYSKYAEFFTIGSAISNLAQNLVCNKAIKSEQKMKRTGKMKQKMKKAGKTKQKMKKAKICEKCAIKWSLRVKLS